MRRSVVMAMSGVSAVVLISAARSGATPHHHLATAPAGLVSTSPATTSPTPPPSRSPKPHRASPSPTRVRHSSSPTPKPRPRPTAPPRPTSITVNGAAIDTRYGPVQVQITVTGGRITRARAIDYPQGSSTDQQINSYAIPQLDQETLDAQSANIDSVSGATYTSDGYIQSLQSAIDAANAR